MRHILILIALLHITANAQTSVDKVLQSIEENNLELQAIRAENKSVILDLKSENTIAGPTIEYSPFYTRGYRGVASSELVVTEGFDFPTQYFQRNRKARLEGNALESSYRARRREIMLEAHQLCYEIIGQNQRISLLKERQEQSSKIATLLKKRMDAGDANVLDLNKALLEQIQSAQVLVQEENLLKESRQRLQALNGNILIQLDDTVFQEYEDLKSEFPVSLPVVQNAESVVEASRHDVNIARFAWLPSISVGYRRNTEEGTNLNGFLVGASFPLLSTSGKVKAAKQRRISAELRLEQVRQEVENAQRAKYQQLMQLRTVMDHSDVNLIRETLPLLEKALQHGQINALQYYTEYNDLFDKLLTHISVHCQFMKLYAEIYME